MPRGRDWSIKQDEALLHALLSGERARDVAKRTGRTIKAIYGRTTILRRHNTGLPRWRMEFPERCRGYQGAKP